MNISSFVTNRSNSVIRGAVGLVLGLILILWPGAVSKYIIYLLGICFAVSGIIAGILYFRQTSKKEIKSPNAAHIGFMGLGNLVFGLLLIIFPTFFIDILMFFLAAVLMLFSIVQLLSVYYTSKVVHVNPLLYLIPAALLICSVVVFFNPFDTTMAVMAFCGVIILIYSVTELVEAWVYRNVSFKKDQYGQVHEVEDVSFEEEK